MSRSSPEAKPCPNLEQAAIAAGLPQPCETQTDHRELSTDHLLTNIGQRALRAFVLPHGTGAEPGMLIAVPTGILAWIVPSSRQALARFRGAGKLLWGSA